MENQLGVQTAPFQDQHWTIEEHPVLRLWSYRYVKRGLDMVVASAALLVLSPLFVVIAALVKATSSGPVLYRWNVVGRNGRRFRGYKFRTMSADADQRRTDYEHLNEMKGPVFKIATDPRITPIGFHLRKWSLDELPQLWSVLVGDMSLVGPRPAFPHEWARYRPDQRERLSVAPGITCLWQVSGRNRISDFDEWVRLDREYIRNWSLGLDLRILVRTVAVVAMGTGR